MKNICEAIRNQHVVTFLYDDLRHIVEPHFVGYDSDGELTLSGWQLQGGSEEGWRDFHISKINELCTTGESFQKAREGFNPKDSTLEQIVCRL